MVQGSFYPSIGTNGTIGTNRRSLTSIGTPLVNHMSLRGLRVCAMVQGRFYPSIGTNGTIGTIGRSVNSMGTPLVNRISLGRLGICAMVQKAFYPSIGTNGTIGANGCSLRSIGAPLVNCIPLGGLLPSNRGDSIHPLERIVRLVPMDGAFFFHCGTLLVSLMLLGGQSISHPTEETLFVHYNL